jgi:type VI secretion system protein ImpF
MSALERYARATLFDRLVDLEPELSREPQPLRTFNKKELLASVRSEVGRLLNTRCPTPANLDGEQEQTVIDYGIPDFSSFYPQNPDDQRRLALVVSKAISAFEPRLQQVRATVEEVENDIRALRIRIDAVLVYESVREPVSFPVVVRFEK